MPELAVDVARILYDKKIEALLWGWLAIALLGHDEVIFPSSQVVGALGIDIIDEVNFIVPDNKVVAAVKALIEAMFTPCTDPNCFIITKEETANPDRDPKTWYRDYRPVSVAHFHVHSLYPEYKVLVLYEKSRLLPCLPDIPLETPAPDNRYFTTSNDEWLKREKFGTLTKDWRELYPVKVLTPLAFCEALMVLNCRDDGHAEFLFETWVFMLSRLDYHYHMHDPTFGDRLKPHFRPLFNNLVGRTKVPKNGDIYDPAVKLRQKLIDAEELSGLPPHELVRQRHLLKQRELSELHELLRQCELMRQG